MATSRSVGLQFAILILVVAMLSVNENWVNAQFFTKPTKSIPRMGRRSVQPAISDSNNVDLFGMISNSGTANQPKAQAFEDALNELATLNSAQSNLIKVLQLQM